MMLSFTQEFLHPYVPTASFNIWMYTSSDVIGTVRGSFRSCQKMIVHGSKSYQCLGFTELVLLCFNFPHVNNHCKASIQDTKLLRMFLLPVIKKYIDWLKTKMTDVDPSIVWQHVPLMENNYLKAWYGQYFLSIDLLWLTLSFSSLDYKKTKLEFLCFVWSMQVAW